MDDKWFVFLEDDWLYFHRSWTGVCIYQVKFKAAEERHQIIEVWVNRSFKQYKNVFKTFDNFLLGFLIKHLSRGNKI